MRGERKAQPFGHSLDGTVRRHLTSAHSVSAVAFAGANGQTVGLPTQPLHSCLSAIRCAQGLFHAIAFKLDVVARCVTLESARAVQVLDSNFVLSIAADELEECSFWTVPLA